MKNIESPGSPARSTYSPALNRLLDRSEPPPCILLLLPPGPQLVCDPRESRFIHHPEELEGPAAVSRPRARRSRDLRASVSRPSLVRRICNTSSGFSMTSSSVMPAWRSGARRGG
eukprot:767359-Hanusia_phi.AAC.8